MTEGAVGELVSEAGRGLAGLWNRDLSWAAATGVAVVGALAAGAHRRDLRTAGWPLLVVVIVVLAVRGRAVLPVGLALLGWWGTSRAGLGPPARPVLLFVATLMTALGLYGTLPETEEVVVLVAALVVIGVAGWAGVVALGSVRPGQVGALAALLPWVVLAGDGQRSRALLAGALCLAMLAVVVLLLRAPAAPLLALHTGVTVAASRWVGIAPDDAEAVRRALPVLAVGAAGSAVVWWLRSRHAPVVGGQAVGRVVSRS